METILSNLAGQVRKERLDGRDYLVAPITLLVPGVLNGSHGPHLYPEREVANTADAWNGMPMLLGHPPNVSGRSPKIIETAGVGTVFNAEMNGKLRAEGWFDIEKANRIEPRLIPAITSNQKVEVSTGLRITSQNEAGVANGANYVAIARNYKPDHLAILFDQQGACSVGDGCGINNEKQIENEGVWRTIQGTAVFIEDGKITKGPRKFRGKTLGQVATSKRADENLYSKNQSNLLIHKEKNMGTQETIDYLVANCDCWDESDREELSDLDDKVLNALKVGVETGDELAVVENELEGLNPILEAARKGFQAGNGQVSLNSQGKWVTNAKKKMKNTDDEDHEDDEEELDEEGNPITKKKGVPVKNSVSFESLPTEMQEDIKFARNARQQHKHSLIGQILASNSELTEDQKLAHGKRLEGRSIADLEADVALLPVVSNQEETTRPSYLGAAVPVTNTKPENMPEPLGQPVWDFAISK